MSRERVIKTGFSILTCKMRSCRGRHYQPGRNNLESASEIARTGTPVRARKSGWTYPPISVLTMVLLIVTIWIVVALLIDPRGEFPLNDDWAYAAAVKTLLGGGGIRLSGWTTVNLIAQVLWGALFCLPFGFSFTALRISTLVLGLTGVLALYGLLREGDADHGTALFGALLLAFNPLYLVLSYTFMSDVPFIAFSILSFYFLLRGMRQS